ncbi:MAG: MATE family efflux transporter [Bacillota bacterium]|nr:MATE family efflux transporter [Bacillota bacterium]
MDNANTVREEMNTYKENKMGVMPVNKLLVTMSLPMITSMIIQAMYNIVDSIFVARISEDALSAVSLAFPVQNLLISVAVGTGVGINALLSRSLGEKDLARVNATANNGLFLALCSYIVIALLGVFGSGFFFRVQTDISAIVDQGTTYLTIITAGSLAVFMQVTYERLLQSTGKTFYTMITQGTGAIINIILDPILIFGFFGLPAMGVAGAAIATIIGQTIGMALAIYFNKTKNTEVKVSFKGFRPNGWVIKNIYAVGIPSIIMSSVSSVMTFGINKILLGFSSTAVAVFGVYFRLQSFVFMPVFGLNNGMVPIIAYNYGAAKRERITKTIKLSVMYAIGMMLIGLICFIVFSKYLLLIFNASDTMLAIGIPALRIIATHFAFAGFCIIATSVFQALGNGVISLVISVCRQLVVLLPVAFLLSKIIGINGVWWAFPIAEVVSLALCSIFLRRIYKKKIQVL